MRENPCKHNDVRLSIEPSVSHGEIQLTTGARSGTMTVAGGVSTEPTSVTVERQQQFARSRVARVHYYYALKSTSGFEHLHDNCSPVSVQGVWVALRLVATPALRGGHPDVHVSHRSGSDPNRGFCVTRPELGIGLHYVGLQAWLRSIVRLRYSVGRNRCAELPVDRFLTPKVFRLMPFYGPPRRPPRFGVAGTICFAPTGQRHSAQRLRGTSYPG
jgi:hypothetical protein